MTERARISTGRWACLLLALSLPLGACEDDECAPVEDLSGSWIGTFSFGDSEENSSTPERDGGVAGNYIQLIINDTGNRITGFYTTGSGNQGTIDGLQNGSTVLFDVDQTAGCAGTFDATAEVCGRDMRIALEGEDCQGDDQKGSAKLLHSAPRTGECNPEWVGDGECDEPQGTDYCAPGTDPEDCEGVTGLCLTRDDGVCDEPIGTGLCSLGTDVLDCRDQESVCDWRDDGVCDEPNGTGLCRAGEDPNDCGNVVPGFCSFTNDGVCDEPENGGSCPEGSDFNDCNRNQICAFQNDGFCDEATGACPSGSDFNDCNGFSCPFFGDGRCDEPEGTGQCNEGTDSADCPVPIFCGINTCTAPISNGAIPFTPCCFSDGDTDACGVSTIGAFCFQPETIVRSTCQQPPEIAMFLGVGSGPGCCRSEGTCGIDLTAVGLGCAPIDASPIPVASIPCTIVIPPEDDAGTP